MRDPQEKRNLLDLVFTSNATLTKSSTNIPGISDHAIIITDMDTKPYYQKIIPRKSYILWRKENLQKIEDLEHLADEIKKTKKQANTEELWIIFKDSLQQSMDKNIPSKQIRSNNKLPWFNKKIKRMLKKKQSLYNQAKITKKWSNYRCFQKECRRQVRMLKTCSHRRPYE
jgi:hypothetical protein